MAKLVAPAWVAERIGTREITLVDPRRPMKYLAGHLPGAINIPPDRIVDMAPTLLPNKQAEIVVYCASPS